MIYFVRNVHCGSVKVGSSDKPEARLSSLRTASPFPLELLGTIPGGIAEERKLHDLLDTTFERLEGEWFEGTPELLGYLRSLVRDAKHGLLTFLLRQEVIEPHLCYVTSKAVGFTVSIFWGDPPLFDRRKYQVMRWDESPGPGRTFWTWHLDNRPQWFDSPVEAAAAFVLSWDDWRITNSLSGVAS